MIQSRIFQPERLFINSNDDPTIPSDEPKDTYHDFSCRLPLPILTPKRLQLLRFSCPVIAGGLTFPDYQLVFVYTRQLIAGGPIEYCMNRFLPTSSYPGGNITLPSTMPPVNRYVPNYINLVDMLNASAAAADNSNLLPNHQPGDIVWSFDATDNKFYFQGTNPLYKYGYMGYMDPMYETLRKQVRTDSGAQPSVANLPFNLRLGFNMPFTKIVGSAYTDPIVATGYADLVYSQNVFVGSNLVVGSTVATNGMNNLLAVVPLNTAPLGVALYSAPAVWACSKIPREINEVDISLYDDNLQPLPIGNNAVVSCEIGFQYD
jgi:hypothetical protein